MRIVQIIRDTTLYGTFLGKRTIFEFAPFEPASRRSTKVYICVRISVVFELYKVIQLY